jgi:hypothetical protein
MLNWDMAEFPLSRRVPRSSDPHLGAVLQVALVHEETRWSGILTVLLVATEASRRRQPGPDHQIEDAASDFCLSPLIGQSPGVKPPADNGFVAAHCRFDQAPTV